MLFIPKVGKPIYWTLVQWFWAYTSISPLYVKRLFSMSTHIVLPGNSAPGISCRSASHGSLAIPNSGEVAGIERINNGLPLF
jgi:hypothetical protein